AEAAQPAGPNTFSLSEVVFDVVAVLEVLAEEGAIRINFASHGSDEMAVTGDRNLIRSAVMNVIHNAIKFSPPESSINVVYSASVSEEQFAELIVEDQGP